MPSTAVDQPAPIYAVCGAEVFLKRQAMDQIIREVLGDSDRSLAMSEYDGAASPELAGVLDDLRTLPFLSKRRLVVVRDADKFITMHRDALEDYVGKPSPTGVLLMECKSLPMTTRLAKQIAKVGKLLKFEALKGANVTKWVCSHAKDAYDVTIDFRAADKLVDLTGTDLGVLDAELLKCVLYISGRKQITLTDIEVLVGQYREEQVWNLVSAVNEGDEQKALKIWEDVCQTDRASEARSIGGIAYTVRRLLKAKRAEEGGASSRDLMRELWIHDERELRRQLGAFTTSQVEEMLTRLLEADVAVKTGLCSVRTSVEKFIVEMSRCSASRRKPSR